MKRREFITASLLMPLWVNSSAVWSAGKTDVRFLFVFLRGAYDSSSLLIPYTSDYYYEARPKLAIPKPQATNGALVLDDAWALHPALQDTMFRLWERKQVLFVPFAGTPDMSRSHFDTQDVVERGLGENGKRTEESGFLNRLAMVLAGKAVPVAFANNLPLSFQGKSDVANFSLRSGNKSRLNEDQMKMLAELYEKTDLEAKVRTGLENKRQVIASFEKEKQAASRNAINPKGFELEAQRMAGMMKGKYNLGFIDVGNWDTHVNQGGVNGQLTNYLVNLGKGLNTFAKEMGPAWNNTVVYVISEFGRTFKQNGTGGTDHGHGSVHWVLGGKVNGGHVLGEQEKVTLETLNQKRDYKVLNDYRDVLGGMFRQIYGLTPKQIDLIFPDSNPRSMKLV
ncbi:DUF1501 domain-containing protein [Advenella sp. FME57]|uniref:DUF1501 domain-containing protein n=1 Tax=Advenella sp. FME57 TaxID=2742604 RepID=UPI001865E5EB|nr:DUF1501 domain-containing protein [Advenella sp. FME57]